MARKNPFANILTDKEQPAERSVVEYAARGASRSILGTLDEMAARADKLATGETIVELDPDTIDASFVGADQLAVQQVGPKQAPIDGALDNLLQRNEDGDRQHDTQHQPARGFTLAAVDNHGSIFAAS